MASAVSRHLKAPLQLLVEAPVYCGVSNKYAEPDSVNYLEQLPGLTRLPGVPFPCYYRGLVDSSDEAGDRALPPSPQTTGKRLLYYAMDVASLYPTLALGVSRTDTVLDMCAAPGGKAFALMQMLDVKKGAGALALNDVSYNRVKRLQGVLNHCMGKGSRFSGSKRSIRVTQRFGEEWAKIEPNEYDKVLVDAPCSSDRHHAESWMTKGVFHPQSEELKKLQCNLLLAAIHAVKDGGVVVYSTCTEATQENDEVVEAVCRSAGEVGVGVDTSSPSSSINGDFTALLSGNLHRLTHGVLILPTCSLNIGPMYTSRLAITKK